MKSPELEQHICGFNDGEHSCDCFVAGQEAERARSKEEIKGLEKQLLEGIKEKMMESLPEQMELERENTTVVDDIIYAMSTGYNKCLEEVKEKIKKI